MSRAETQKRVGVFEMQVSNASFNRRSQGFSLVELLVATAMTGIIIVAALAVFTVQHQTYVVVDQVSEVQQNARSAASLIERDVRNAGYMVPPAAAACGVDRIDAPDLLYLSDHDAIASVDELPSDLRGSELSAQVMGAFNSTVGVLSINVDDVVIDGQASFDNDGNGIDDSDFRVGGGAILVDLANPSRGAACGVVTAVPSSTVVSVDFDNSLGSELLTPDHRLVPAIVYVLSTAGLSAGRLERNGVLLVKEVEDLQIAWFFDTNGNGDWDATETPGSVGSVYDNTLADANDLRELRVSLIVRTAYDDPRNPDSASTGQAVENRTSNIAPDDGRRRRIETSTIRLRNVAS
ncbi:PilW family protein [Myxococcota bacterium]|nr:PilW family protein [Myxococcota bacterium]